MKLGLLLLAAACACAQPARIEGSVVSITGEPIARAQVFFQNSGSNYTATTGEDGKFVIENIVPAQDYRLRAQRAGYLTAYYDVRPVTGPAVMALAAGESRKNLTLTMIQQGVITGRITDAAGDPISGVTVIILRPGYQNGEPRWITHDTIATDDQGDFRASNLVPGRYYVLVRGLPGAGGATVPIATFYPNAIDPRGASPIDLAAGQEKRGIDIRMHRAPAYSIRGKVVDSAGQPTVATISFTIDHATAGYGPTGSTQSRPDGSFEIRGLPPATYGLETLSSGATGTPHVGRFPVTIADRDVTGLTLSMYRGVTVSGAVRLDGGKLEELKPKTDPSADVPVSVRLTMVDGYRSLSVPVMQVKPDGTFSRDNIALGRFFMTTPRLPEEVYVKSVRMGDEDVTGRVFEIRGNANLDVLLAKGAAKLSGTVVNDKDEPLPGILVTLWTREPDFGLPDKGAFVATTSRAGEFEFRNLRPGAYYVAAWEDIDRGLAIARGFLALMSNDGAPIELKQGSAQTVKIKLIPRARIKAAEEKIPAPTDCGLCTAPGQR